MTKLGVWVCVVDGVWKTWGEWGTCTKPCGAGKQTRQRMCEEPLYGGAACLGVAEETGTCNEIACPGE